MNFLVGDIGATKSVLALATLAPHEPIEAVRITAQQRFDTQSFPSLDPMLDTFVRSHNAQPQRVCLAIAGPVSHHEHCTTTNIPWPTLRASVLSARLNAPCILVNDFEAQAYGILATPDAQRISLHAATREPFAPIAVLGAGTGLGHASIVFANNTPIVLPSEGGHSDYAPRSLEQLELLRWMLEGRSEHGKLSHVSTERIVSGLGLRVLYAFVRERNPTLESPTVKHALEAGHDVGEVVGTHALQGDPLCKQAMSLFVDGYGAEAGNVALRLLARGGVVLVGGIAGKILPLMRDGTFVRAYLDKGRYRSLLESISVDLIDAAETPLRGAVAAARYLMPPSA